jgi:hypothetical protein
MEHDPSKMQRNRTQLPEVLRQSLRLVYKIEPTDRFDSLLRALDDADRSGRARA